jgi:hypothetical protein
LFDSLCGGQFLQQSVDFSLERGEESAGRGKVPIAPGGFQALCQGNDVLRSEIARRAFQRVRRSAQGGGIAVRQALPNGLEQTRAILEE